MHEHTYAPTQAPTEPEIAALESLMQMPPPACQATTLHGATCTKPAAWLLNIHGCHQVLLCTQHLRAWEHRAQSTMAPYCRYCGQVWASVSDTYTMVAL